LAKEFRKFSVGKNLSPSKKRTTEKRKTRRGRVKTPDGKRGFLLARPEAAEPIRATIHLRPARSWGKQLKKEAQGVYGTQHGSSEVQVKTKTLHFPLRECYTVTKEKVHNHFGSQ